MSTLPASLLSSPVCNSLGFWYSSITGRYQVHDNKIRQVERRIKELEEKNFFATPQELASIIGKIVSFELATSYVPRLRCHKYFSWIARTIKEDKDWRKQKRFPKTLWSSQKEASRLSTISSLQRSSAQSRIRRRRQRIVRSLLQR